MVANLGDAKAVLARSTDGSQNHPDGVQTQLKAIVLTREHKPIFPLERARIEKVWNSSIMIWLDHQNYLIILNSCSWQIRPWLPSVIHQSYHYHLFLQSFAAALKWSILRLSTCIMICCVNHRFLLPTDWVHVWLGLFMGKESLFFLKLFQYEKKWIYFFKIN